MIRSFRPPAGASRPRLLTLDQAAQELGGRIGLVASPAACWSINLDCQGTDGRLTDVDVQYNEERRLVALVRTTRRPELDQVPPELLLRGFLLAFIANHRDRPLADDVTLSGPESMTLNLAGTRADATVVTAPGHFAATTRTGVERIVLAAPLDLRGLVCDLTFHALP